MMMYNIIIPKRKEGRAIDIKDFLDIFFKAYSAVITTMTLIKGKKEKPPIHKPKHSKQRHNRRH